MEKDLLLDKRGNVSVERLSTWKESIAEYETGLRETFASHRTKFHYQKEKLSRETLKPSRKRVFHVKHPNKICLCTEQCFT